MCCALHVVCVVALRIWPSHSAGGAALIHACTHICSQEKQKELRDKRGEQEYEAQLDKKVCPGCGKTQKYYEVVDRRHQVLYTHTHKHTHV